MLAAIRAAFGSARLAAALTVVIVGVLNAAAPVILGWLGIVPDEAMLARINELALWIAGGLIAWIVGDSVRRTPDSTVKVLVLLAVGLAACGSAMAEDVVISGDGQKSVTRYFRIDYDAAGVATVSPLVKVIRHGEPAPPADPQPPTGPVLTPFEKEIHRLTQLALAAGATKTTGARVSAVYSLVASGVADGSIPPANAIPAIRVGTDAALLGQADAASWKPWRDAVGGALTALQQEGSLQTKEQYAATLRSIEKGLNAATGFVGVNVITKIPAENLGILDGIDLVKLMEFINFMVTLLKTFGILK